MSDKKFNPKYIDKLNDLRRLKTINPEILWKLLALKEPEVGVDIGAGTGFFAIPFADKMTHGKVYACDTADVMIAWMQENIPSPYKGQILPVKSEEVRIPLPNAIADLVYMINLHHELEAPDLLLIESKRLMKRGAKIMIVDWKTVKTPEGPPLSIRISPVDIIDQLKNAGFGLIVQHEVLPYHNTIIGEKI